MTAFKIMFAKPNLSTARKKLSIFINNGLQNYSKSRNFDYGPGKRNNVSKMSPFIRKRIIHEKEIILSCLKKYEKLQIDKYIQEIFWRIYWKGWLEGRPKVWDDYVSHLEKYNKNIFNKSFYRDYINATNAQTGINCFDQWVIELIKYGYLHNHARMWFASIWIFTLNLPWELGADFFYRNLIDADAASNTLSWRWVAGLHTSGKYYLAQQSNIEKFSNFSFHKKNQLKKKIATPIHQFYKYQKPNFLNESIDNVKFYLINPNNLIYDKELINKLEKNKVVYFNFFDDPKASKTKKKFENDALEEYFKYLELNNIKINKFLNEKDFYEYFNQRSNHLHTFYPCIGYEKDSLDKLSSEMNIEIKYIFDSFDIECWPLAKNGFFKFKNKIDSFINYIKMKKDLI